MLILNQLIRHGREEKRRTDRTRASDQCHPFKTVPPHLREAELSTGLGWMTKKTRNGLVDVPRESVEQGYTEATDARRVINSYAETNIDNSSLGLLALTYGDSSDSKEDQSEASLDAKKTESSNFSAVNRFDSDDSGSPSRNHNHGPSGHIIFFPLRSCEDGDPLQIIDPYEEHGLARADLEDRCYQTTDCSFGFQTNNTSLMADSLKGRSFHSAHTTERSVGSASMPIDNRTFSFASRADEDSSRLHVFCLQHAVEVEQQLRSFGGVHLLLLCHPGSGKQKTIIVAGKWCGKVWMSNQVHALLAGRDDEREKERSFLALPAPEHPKPSVKLEKPSKTHKMDVASVISRVERKRKNNSEIRSASRAKSLKIEEPAQVLDDAADEKVIRQYKRNFRNKKKKEMKESPHPMDSCEQETKQSTSHIEDVLEGGPSTRLRKRTSQPPAGNRAKLVEAKSVTKKRTSNTRRVMCISVSLYNVLKNR